MAVLSSYFLLSFMIGRWASKSCRDRTADRLTYVESIELFEEWSCCIICVIYKHVFDLKKREKEKKYSQKNGKNNLTHHFRAKCWIFEHFYERSPCTAPSNHI